MSDPQLPYKPRPSSVVFQRTREFEQEYRHNSFGFRDVEHAYDKPAGVFRILGLGDSFTYGAGVSFEESYLHRLEAMLNRRGESHPKVEIIKAGIYRYFPEPERLLLQHYGVKYAPDLITVAFLPNDLEDTHHGIDAVTVDESGNLISRRAQNTGELTKFFFTRSELFRLVMSRYDTLRTRREQRNDRDDFYKKDGRLEREWRIVESEYGRMAQIAGSIEARMVVVHIPHSGPWADQHSYPGERLSRWASNHGVEFIDVLAAMKEAAESGENLYYQRDGHCRPAGHAVIAEVLFRELTKRGVVP